MKKLGLYILSAMAAVLMAFGCGGGGPGGNLNVSSIVVTLSPADGANGVTLDAVVTVTFSGAITEPSDWTVVFTVTKDNAGDTLCTDVSYDSDNLVATCTHDDFELGNSYTITVAGLTDVEGKEISTTQATFIVGPAALFKLLRLDGTGLELSSTAIPRAVRVKVTFDRALNDSEIAALEGGFILKQGDTFLDTSFDWSADYTQVTITPARWFRYGTIYTVAVSTGADETNFTTVQWGDVNGDGYSDVVVGAPFANADDGNAYIFLGASNGVGSCDLSGGCAADATIMGNVSWLGVSVAMAGDVNADGYSDVIVGAAVAEGMKGKAHILLGSANGISDCDLSAGCAADATITGENAGDVLGMPVSGAGDINGDGYDDIIVGAHHAEGKKGHAYAFLGSGAGIDSCDMSAGGCGADAVIIGKRPTAGQFGGDRLGNFLSRAGDFNNDGYDDVLIGTFPEDPTALVMEGYAYLFLGSQGGIADCDLSAGSCDDSAEVAISVDHNRNAVSVSGAGDINGDGYDDVVVGVKYAENLKGEAYVFHGTTDSTGDCELFVDCDPQAFVTGAAASDYLGHAVSGAGDVNGDGYDDILVGAHSVDGDRGETYILLGSTEGVRDCDLGGTCLSQFTSVTGESADDRLGYSISTAGDVNADGFADIILGAPNDAGGHSPTAVGHAYILHGSGNGIGSRDLATQSADTTFTGATIDDCLGMVH